MTEKQILKYVAKKHGLNPQGIKGNTKKIKYAAAKTEFAELVEAMNKKKSKP